MLQLREYQKEGVEFLKARRYALLSDPVGAGKSAQAICALNGELHQTDRPVLIICPASVKLHWKNQFAMWKGVTAHIIGSKEKSLPEFPVYIVNYDLINRPDKRIFDLLRKKNFSVVICDEAHRLKNPRAKRTKRVLSKFGVIAKTEKMWFLTGTPIANRPIDLYTILSTCAPHLLHPYDSYLSFAFRYCGAFHSPYGLNTQGASHEKELNQKIATFMLRRRKEEILHELPEVNISKIEFDSTPQIKELIRQEEQATMEEAGESDPAFFKLGEIVRLRKCVAKYKVADSVAFIKDILEEVPKVVVFFHHHEVVREIIRELGKIECVVVSGQDSYQLKHQKVQNFIKSPARVFLGQMQACGEGIDGLQHATNVCVFVEPSWTPSDITQAIGRLHRMGQKDSVTAYILTIKDTIESKMMDTVLWKERVHEKILNQPQQPKGVGMYIEERIEKLEKIIANLANTVDLLVNGKPIKAPAAPSIPPSQMPDPTVKKPGRPVATRTPVKPQPSIPSTTIEQVREVIQKIINADPEGGKTRCVEVVRAASGGGKLSDCNQAQLGKIHEQLSALLSDGNTGIDDV